jgi:hypothetical protein
MVVCAPESRRRRTIFEKAITGDVIPKLGPDVSWLVMRFLGERDLVHTRVRYVIITDHAHFVPIVADSGWYFSNSYSRFCFRRFAYGPPPTRFLASQKTSRCGSTSPQPSLTPSPHGLSRYHFSCPHCPHRHFPRYTLHLPREPRPQLSNPPAWPCPPLIQRIQHPLIQHLLHANLRSQHIIPHCLRLQH